MSTGRRGAQKSSAAVVNPTRCVLPFLRLEDGENQPQREGNPRIGSWCADRDVGFTVMADVRWRLLEALSLAELASSRPEPLQVNLDHLDKAGVTEYMRRKRHRLTAEYTPGRGWAPTNDCPAEEESQPVVMRQVSLRYPPHISTSLGTGAD